MAEGPARGLPLDERSGVGAYRARQP